MSTEVAPKTKSSKRKASSDGDVAVKKQKKEKKLKKSSTTGAEDPIAAPATKRSKASAAQQDATVVTKKKSKNAASSEDSSATHELVAVQADKQPADLDNFRLSDPVKALLRKKGINTLFAIQQATLDYCLDGNDLVGRARTGCGKTLAFVLPIIESLGAAAGGTTRRAYGRAPSVIVLAPTRELAKQVAG